MDTGTFLDAVMDGEAALVEALLAEQPTLIHARDDNGVSPVMLAAYYGQSAIIPILRRHMRTLDVFEASAVGDAVALAAALDAAPEVIGSYSPDGWTPLHLAVFFGHRAVAELLLSRGADASLVSHNPMDVTPLQSALARRNEDCAALLVDHGAEVGLGASQSWPPIAYTGANGLLAAAALLLDRGADVNARTPDGKTALTLAREKDHRELVELLLARGGVE